MKLTEERLKRDSKQGWQLSFNEISDILSNQEKAETYDRFTNGLGWIEVIIQENKSLKKEIIENRKISNIVRDWDSINPLSISNDYQLIHELKNVVENYE